VSRSHQAVRDGGVAGDVAVGAGLHLGRGDLVGDGEVLRDLAVVEARVQGCEVGLEDVGLGPELALQELLGSGGRAGVQPRQQAESEHVLGPLLVLAGQGEVGERVDGERGQAERVHVVGVETAILNRRHLVVDLGKVALGELIGVDDDRAPARHIAQVGLESGWVHRHQDVRCVAGGQDVVVRET